MADRPPLPRRWLYAALGLLCCLPLTGRAADAKVSCGASHCLALHTDGTLWAWGNNKEGQLGDGSATNQPIPVRVRDLTEVVDVSAGYNHSLAVRSDGTVWGWGKNDLGQVGDGATANKTSPQRVINIANVTKIAAGGGHSLALASDGRVWAWGNNWDGQVGVGTDGDSYPAPRQVQGVYNVIGIAAGENHSLAVRSDGTLFAWGLNITSQLGDGTNVSRSLPVYTGLSGVVSVAAGSTHSLAARIDGSVWGWGHSRYGQVGVGAIGDILMRPSKIAGIENVALVGAGKFHSLALLASGRVWAWGQNLFGQLGDGGQANREAPVPIVVVDRVVMPAAGEKHTSVIKTDGYIWSWGDNTAGQLGAPNADLSTPARITSLDGVKNAAGGAEFSLALRGDGSLWSWGDNEKGQLGDGSTTPRTIPSPLSHITGVLDLAAGTKHAVVVKQDGTVWSWGANSKGQLGDGTKVDRLTPVQVPGLTEVAAVSAGFGHTVALRRDGTVWAWGQNDFGQLGDGAIADRETPKPVNGLAGVLAIATGEYHSLALLPGGLIKAWGQNNFGQLGDDTGTSRMTPVTVLLNPDDAFTPFEGATRIAAGASHSMALKADGSLWVWGYNNLGQLGNGTIATQKLPSLNPFLAGIQGITTDHWHSLAIDPARALKSWGKNEFGQLGDDSTAAKTLPVPVKGLSGVVGIATGGNHSLAIKDDGSLWAWGANAKGQLGNGKIAKVAGLRLLKSGALSIKNLTIHPGENPVFKADEAIATEGDVIIMPGGSASFIAPVVQLGPGFHAQAGSTFYAGSQKPAARADRLALGPALAMPSALASAPLIQRIHRGPPAPIPWPPPPSARALAFAELPAALRQLLEQTQAEASDLFSDAAGRFIVLSTDTPLLPEDRNSAEDVYLYVAAEGRLLLVSASAIGRIGNGPSGQPRIDGGGGLIVYASQASNLVEGDGNGVSDIYLYRRAEGVTERVSYATDQSESPFAASHPAISGDGRQILYQRSDGVSDQIYALFSAWPRSPARQLSRGSDELGRPLENRLPTISDEGRYVSYLEWRPAEGPAACRRILLDQWHDSVSWTDCPKSFLP